MYKHTYTYLLSQSGIFESRVHKELAVTDWQNRPRENTKDEKKKKKKGGEYKEKKEKGTLAHLNRGFRIPRGLRLLG